MTQLVMQRPHLQNVPRTLLPNGCTVRKANASEQDERELAGVLSAAFGEEWSQELVRQRLTRATDVRAVYVVVSNGHIVATASSRWIPERYPGMGYVHWVATHPEHTRGGLGAYVFAQVLNDFVERQYPAAVLETDDFRIPAIRTYLRFGFIPVYAVADEDHRGRWSRVFENVFGPPLGQSIPQ